MVLYLLYALASQLIIENGELKIKNRGVLNNSQLSILNSQFETKGFCVSNQNKIFVAIWIWMMYTTKYEK